MDSFGYLLSYNNNLPVLKRFYTNEVLGIHKMTFSIKFGFKILQLLSKTWHRAYAVICQSYCKFCTYFFQYTPHSSIQVFSFDLIYLAHIILNELKLEYISLFILPLNDHFNYF